MTYGNDVSLPEKKWLRKEHEDIIILLKIFVQKNRFCMGSTGHRRADTCRRDIVESGRRTNVRVTNFFNYCDLDRYCDRKEQFRQQQEENDLYQRKAG